MSTKRMTCAKALSPTSPFDRFCFVSQRSSVKPSGHRSSMATGKSLTELRTRGASPNTGLLTCYPHTFAVQHDMTMGVEGKASTYWLLLILGHQKHHSSRGRGNFE